MTDYVNELLAAVQRQRDVALAGQARAEAQAAVLGDRIRDLETQLSERDTQVPKPKRSVKKSD